MFNFGYETQAFFIDLTAGTVGFAVNWLLQSTILILTGLAVAKLIKSRGSAAESLVYRTTLVAIFACPLATLVLSATGFTGWSISMRIAWESQAVLTELFEEPKPPVPAAIATNSHEQSEFLNASLQTHHAKGWKPQRN